MAYEFINVGLTPNDGNGDTLRDAIIKINDNFNLTYTKEEVNNLLSDIDVDLSNYYTKSETISQIELATENLATETYVDNSVNDLNIPTKTSELINDGNGNNPFLTITDIPNISYNIDQVLQTGNTSNRQMNLGNIRINVDTLLYTLQILNSSGQPAHRWAENGNYLANNSIRIAAPSEGLVELGKPSTGVLVVSNTSASRSTRVMFDTVTSNVEVRFRNLGGTVALLSDLNAVAFPEAPLDGNIYGRSAGTWVPVYQGAIDPTLQNIAKSGLGYQLLTINTSLLTLGTNSLMFGSPASIAHTSGDYSVSFGELNRNEGLRSFTTGTINSIETTAFDSGALGSRIDINSAYSFGMGYYLNSGTDVIGQSILGKYSHFPANNNTQQFIVAIGTSQADRQHGLEVLTKENKGFVRAPYQTALDMHAEFDDKILVHKEYVEFYYTPKLETNNLENRITTIENKVVTANDVIQALTNATPTEIDEIKSLLGIV